MLEKIKNRSAKITVIGTGYVGLPLALAFAEEGFQVTGFDINKEVIENLKNGQTHMTEMCLTEKIQKTLDSNNFIPSTIISSSDIFIITVPTPVDDFKNPNMKYIKSAAESIATVLKEGNLVILESTVYPGATEEVIQPILEEKTGLKAGVSFGLGFSPERINPGDKVNTIKHVAKVVGAIDKNWTEVLKELYTTIITAEVFVASNIKTAEASKIIENIQRDLNIGLMNELAIIFEKLDIDITEVIKAASTKWNFNPYFPSMGVGGHCLPVDPYYLVWKANQVKYSSKIITAGREINNSMPKYCFDIILEELNKQKKPINQSKIAILGVAYKGNVGDCRESPVLTLISLLKKFNANLYIYDPLVEKTIISSIKNTTACDSFDQAVEKSDCIVVSVEHDEFKAIDFKALSTKFEQGKKPIIFDGKNLFDPELIKNTGFVYRGIGRK